MSEMAKQTALDLLSEPFSTKFGFSYACVEAMKRLKPEERPIFLENIVEKFQLVKPKKKLTKMERLLEPQAINSLVEKQHRELEIIYNATITQYPPTPEFVKFLLGAMDSQRDSEDKAIILWFIVSRNLLPYAPQLPKPAAFSDEEIFKHLRAYPKETAMLLRLANIETDRLMLGQLCDLFIKILPKTGRERTALAILFIKELLTQVKKSEIPIFDNGVEASRQKNSGEPPAGDKNMN